MNGRLAAWFTATVLVLALGAQLLRAHRHLTASGTVKEAKQQLNSVIAGESPAGQLSRLVPGLRTASKLTPSSLGPVATLGDTYHVLGRLEAAAETYDRALALEPRPELYLNQGLVAFRQGDPVLGSTLFGTAFRLDPRLQDAVPAAWGAYLFSAGFEEGDLADWSWVVGRDR